MFTISLNGKKTIYEQIRDQIINFIALGVMKPHEKMPSVRSLALDLGINPNTVFKAYQELEREGYIYMMPKKGAFVADIKQSNTDLEGLKVLVRSYKDQGLVKEELLKVIEEIYGG